MKKARSYLRERRVPLFEGVLVSRRALFGLQDRDFTRSLIAA